MAEPAMLAFVHHLRTDEALRERVSQARGLQDVTHIAAQAGYFFSASDLEIGVHELEETELGERELDAVTGGLASNQTQMQSVSQVAQLLSNIMNSDSDAKANAVRNLRS